MSGLGSLFMSIRGVLESESLEETFLGAANSHFEKESSSR